MEEMRKSENGAGGGLDGELILCECVCVGRKLALKLGEPQKTAALTKKCTKISTKSVFDIQSG